MEVVDEFWQSVTNITQISVFDAGTSTLSTISSDRAGDLVMTNPITTSSTNTTLSQSLGTVRWFQQAATYKVTVTDGTKTLTIDDMNSTLIRFPWFPNYIGTAASLSVNDNQSITVGTDSDMVLAWNNGSDFLSWIPASDGSKFNLGTSGTTKNVDFNWFVGTALGIKGDEGAATLVIDGVTTSINTSSNFATNINTGTSTGAVTIGSSTSGTLALETTAGMTLLADDASSIKTSAGTMLIEITGGDLTIDSPDKSILIDGGESATDAVIIAATGGAGGVELTSGTGDITLDSGDDIFLEADTGTGDVISLINTQGTAEGATILRSVAGGVDIDAATGKNIAVTGGQFIYTSNEDVASAFSVITNTGTSETITIVNTLGSGASAILLDAKAGAVDINATGATDGDMTIDVGDDMTVTVTGDHSLDVTGVATYKGALYADTRIIENHSASHTLTSPTNIGTLITVDTAAVIITLPAIETGATYTIMNIGADGTEIHVDVNASDKILGGCEFAVALDDGDKLTNTGATADKGDYVTFTYGTAVGWFLTEMNGIWADGG